MEIKRKTEILVETTRRLIVRQSASTELVFCPACGEAMFAAEKVAACFQINCRAVYQFVEAGAAHFIETEAGATLVCPASLTAILFGETGESPDPNTETI